MPPKLLSKTIWPHCLFQLCFLAHPLHGWSFYTCVVHARIVSSCCLTAEGEHKVKINVSTGQTAFSWKDISSCLYNTNILLRKSTQWVSLLNRFEPWFAQLYCNISHWLCLQLWKWLPLVAVTFVQDFRDLLTNKRKKKRNVRKF